MKTEINWLRKGRTKEYGRLYVRDFPEGIELEKAWDGRRAQPIVSICKEDGQIYLRVDVKRDIVKESDEA